MVSLVRVTGDAHDLISTVAVVLSPSILLLPDDCLGVVATPPLGQKWHQGACKAGPSPVGPTGVSFNECVSRTHWGSSSPVVLSCFLPLVRSWMRRDQRPGNPLGSGAVGYGNPGQGVLALC